METDRSCAGVVARELYDHRQTRGFPTDFNEGENVNVANQTKYSAILATLSARLRAQFGGATKRDGRGGGEMARLTV